MRIFAADLILVNIEAFGRCAKDAEVHIKKVRAIMCRCFIKVIRQEMACRRFNHPVRARQRARINWRRGIQQQLRAARLVVARFGIIDSVVKADGVYDRHRIMQVSLNICHVAQQRLYM